MEELTINLLPLGAEGASFRSRDENGQRRMPQVLIDRGSRMIVKAKLVSILHGMLEPDGDAASLLVFEFRFLTPKSKRFKQSFITIKFEDGEGPSSLDPEVNRIAPHGEFALNRHEITQDVSKSFNANLNVNLPGSYGGGGIGYNWSMSGKKAGENCTSLRGEPRRLKAFGEETAVQWSMEEDKAKENGIPTFLRTAVVLRHDEPGPFRFTVEIDTLDSTLFFGSKTSKMLDPFNVNPSNTAADEAAVDKLGAIDLACYAHVQLSTPVTVD